MNSVGTPAVESTFRHTFLLDAFTVDPVAGQLEGPAGREQLDPKVMDVLVVLAARAGAVVLREDLLHALWPGIVVTDDALSRCIYQLRRHLSTAGGSNDYKRLIETLPKRGYRLNCAPPTLLAAHAAQAAPAVARMAATVPPGVSRRVALRVAAAVAALVSVLGVGFWSLYRAEFFWRDPLADARFSWLTDFEGIEEGATFSRDGDAVAFLSDRSGTFDVWVSRIGTGDFRNWTDGLAPELRNPAVRTVEFTPDGSEVLFWIREARQSAGAARIDLWAAPTDGGPMRPYLEGVAEVAWSTDGARMLYRTPADGDPMFVTEPGEKVGRRIFAATGGLHCHFPIWSLDDAFVYFVHGRPPDELDIWRIPSAGGEPERITFHDSRVGYPVLLDERTLLYLATDDDGSGPWLYGLDLERRVAHRIGAGLQPYTSLAAGADGRRLVATVTTPRTSLWRVPILERAVEGSDAIRIDAPSLGGRAPRFSADSVLYLSPTNGVEGLWSVVNGTPREVWSGSQGRVAAGVALEPNGRRFAFAAAVDARTRLHVLDPDDASAQVLAPELDVRGAPAWSPDGEWIAVAADRGSGPQLFRVPLDGGSAVPLVDEYSIDPAFSPDGRFLVYRGAESGPSFALRAVTADGAPRPVPSLILPRGASRFVFVPAGTLTAGTGLVVLKGELMRKNLWVVDLDNGKERQLTNFGPDFVIGEFDVSADAREIVLDRMREESDVLLIERAAVRTDG
jgi:DNA-binding winged helix-turn-helix (wHTH) protein/dipeptidyl aminopeptidase/acylaminoacyl peptidase